MTQKWIETDDGPIAVDVHGEPDGPAMVIVPGVMADSAAWGAVAQHVRSSRTVAVVNRRGRHPSSPLTDGYGIEPKSAIAGQSSTASPMCRRSSDGATGV